MREATKTIVRATKESAEKAMSKHIERMQAKGWKVHKEFAGNAGCRFKCITVFFYAGTVTE